MAIHARWLKLFAVILLSNIVALLVWKFHDGPTITSVYRKGPHMQTGVPQPQRKSTQEENEDQLQRVIQNTIRQHRINKTQVDKILQQMQDELRGETGGKELLNGRNKTVSDVTVNVMTTKNPVNSNVVNPHDFRLVINEPNACKHENGSSKNVFMLVVILTVHKNFEERRAIRETWGSPQAVDGREVVSVFLLANTTDSNFQRQVEEESRKYHDIIMEDFKDTYKNLTLKTIMGLKWMTNFCPQAKYILKADDDMYISYENIVRHLSKANTPSENYVVGYVIQAGPIRDPRSKWYMSKELYPKESYPPFCSGTTYALSGDVAGKVYTVSLQTRYLHLEDVFLSICLEKLGIVPRSHGGFHNGRLPYSFCQFKQILTAHQYPAVEKRKIWHDQKFNTTVRC